MLICTDYLHLTKRFGLIATTQLPIQYLLALKPLNPFSWALTSSHEHLNRYHRVLGRATYTLLLLHILFYNIFFLATGIWSKRIVAPVVLYGVFASLLLHAVMFTASSAVRSRSYRLFYLTHWLAVRLIPGLIFLHAPSSRVYIIEGAILLIIDYIARHRRTISNAPSTFDTVPGTNLIKVEATLPLPNLPKFQTHPGSHVFIRLPSSTRPSQSLFSPSGYSFELIRHPFTVSAVNSDSITLIARKRAGPLTKHLSTLSGSHGTLDVQGPYGAIGKTLPSLLTGEYDRILLFAGGVGATFALPVYRTILSYKPSAHVTLIWAVRSAAEATWAVSPTPGAGGGSVLDDRNVQLFLTGDMGVADTSTGEVEMTDLRRDGRGGGGGNRKRPDVRRIVDDTFRKGLEESVAVMVCGPDGMARDVRESVRPWLMKGRRVWWHNEAFGW